MSRKRKTVCELCRKRKNRCQRIGKSTCHYCNSLGKECSLKYQDNEDDDISQPDFVLTESQTSFNEGQMSLTDVYKGLITEIRSRDTKLEELSSQLASLRNEVQKLKENEFIIEPPVVLPTKRKRSSFTSNTLVDDSIENIQLNFFSDMSFSAVVSNLHAPDKDYEEFLDHCQKFVALYKSNEALYSFLAETFLRKSHFWIIPGGVKKISIDYVQQHPFISCVFVLIGMCFLDNDKYSQEQNVIFHLTRDLLGKAILVKHLTDHDIEAMVYLSNFNITRSSSGKQFKLHTEVIANAAVVHSQITFNFKHIFSRIFQQEKYDPKDLFHMRIFSSLQIAHIQACLEYSHPVTTTSDFLLFPRAVLKYPETMILTGDKIGVAKLQLLTEVTKLIYDSKFSIKVLKDINTSETSSTYLDGHCLRIPSLELWKSQNRHLIKKDIAKVLLHGYYYYYVYISQRILQDLKNKKLILYPVQGKPFNFDKKWILKLKRVLMCTLVQYCCRLLKSFFELKSFFIEGSPMFQTDQIIYACHKLISVLDYFPNGKIREKISAYILNLNWRLNTFETKNEALDSMELILKKMILVSNSKTKAHIISPEEVIEEFDFSDAESETYLIDENELRKYEKEIEQSEIGQSENHFRHSCMNLTPKFDTNYFDIEEPDLMVVDPNISLPNSTIYSDPKEYVETFLEEFYDSK